MNVNVHVQMSGPMFTKDVQAVIKRAIVEESLNKVDERLKRSANARTSKGRRLQTNPKNTVTRTRTDLTLEATSTRRGRRNSGVQWINKHIGTAGYSKGIVGSMLPNVLRKTGQRVVQELG